MQDSEATLWMEKAMELLKKNAVDTFWDTDQQFFVNGAKWQISWATQVWMILARVMVPSQ